MDPRLAKWLRWFDVIKVEVQDLVIAKHMFNEVQSMIRSNPKLHHHSSFYDYLTRTYVSHVVSGLRRQIKLDDQSISMSRLFQEMIETPEAFPRRYFVDKYKGSIAEGFADNDFDNFAKPSAHHIDPKFVEADLARLRAATQRCEDFTDKRVAHRDKREPRQPPTYKEVDDCVDLLDELYVKYFLLFKQSSMASLLPTWQYDWKAIFRVPWIEDEN